MATTYLESSIAELDINVKGLRSLDQATKLLEKYEKEAKDVTKSELQRQNAFRKAQSLQQNINKTNEGFNKGLQGTKKGLDSNILSTSRLASKALPALAAVFSVERIIEFTKYLRGVDKEYNTLLKTVQRFSNLNESQNSAISTQAIALSRVYNESADNIIKATNNFAKQTETDFATAFELVQKGFIRGANSSGQFLENLKEYPVQFKNAKLEAEDFIKIATQEQLGGVYSDTLLDTVKELGLSLRELTKAQQDALKPLGEDFNKQIVKDLQAGEKDIVEIFNAIRKRGKEAGLTVSEVQTLVADLGKGANENLGGLEEAFKQLNAAMELNLDETDNLGKQQAELLKVTNELTSAEGRLAKNVEGLNGWFERTAITVKTGFVEALNGILDPYNRFTIAQEQFNNQVNNLTLDKANELLKEHANKVYELNEAYKEQIELDKKLTFGSSLLKESKKRFEVAEQELAVIKDRIKQLKEADKIDNNPNKGSKKSTAQLEAERKAAEAAIKKLAEYNDLIQQLGFSYRKSQADLSRQFLAATQRAELETDKVVSKMEKDIERIRKLGGEAGIDKVEIESKVEYRREAAKLDIEKIKRTLKEEINLQGGGLIPLDSLFENIGGDNDKIREEFKENGLAGGAEAEEAERERKQGERITEELQAQKDREKEIYRDFYNDVKGFADDFLQSQVNNYNQEISERQNKINTLLQQDSIGAEEAIKQEQKNIDKAIKQREKFQQAQQAIALLEAGINIVSGISKIFAETGVGAVAAIPITLGVLGGFLAAVPSFLNGVSGYKDGGEIKGGRNKLIMANEEGTEFVVKADKYKQSKKLSHMINTGQLSDKDLNRFSTFANMAPITNFNNSRSSTTNVDMQKVERYLKILVETPQPSYETSFAMNERGIHAATKRIDKKAQIVDNKR